MIKVLSSIVVIALCGVGQEANAHFGGPRRFRRPSMPWQHTVIQNHYHYYNAPFQSYAAPAPYYPYGPSSAAPYYGGGCGAVVSGGGVVYSGGVVSGGVGFASGNPVPANFVPGTTIDLLDAQGVPKTFNVGPMGGLSVP